MTETKVREEICEVGASLYARGYTVGSAGNISARLDDGWLITPTDACLGLLDPADIAKVDQAGNGRRRRGFEWDNNSQGTLRNARTPHNKNAMVQRQARHGVAWDMGERGRLSRAGHLFPARPAGRR